MSEVWKNVFEKPNYQILICRNESICDVDNVIGSRIRSFYYVKIIFKTDAPPIKQKPLHCQFILDKNTCYILNEMIYSAYENPYLHLYTYMWKHKQDKSYDVLAIALDDRQYFFYYSSSHSLYSTNTPAHICTHFLFIFFFNVKHIL